jgi:hypothetical protein
VDFDPDGRTYVLLEKKRTLRHRGIPFSLLDGGIGVIDAEGKLVRKVWFSDSLVAEPFFRRYLDRRLNLVRRADAWIINPKVKGGVAQHRTRLVDRGHDWLHANTLEILVRDVDGVGHAGDFLVCLCLANTIVVFNRETMNVEWHWMTQELEAPHDPSLLDNDRILLFDNGKWRKWSRVIEFDPKTKKIVWQYRGDEQDPFYSDSRGLAQRLENGNTLISSTQQGRVFEVTPDKEIVWEFYNPDIVDGRLRVPLRMIRLTGQAAAAANSAVGPEDRSRAEAETR